jgi:hypothetical protein
MKKYLAHLSQLLSSDPGKSLDVLDYKAKEAFDLEFASFMDKTLAVRRDKNKRLAQQFIVDNDEYDGEDDYKDDEH